MNFECLGDGVRNLLTIFQAFSGWSDERMRQHFAGMRYGDLKKQVAEMVVAHLEPFQKRYREITGEPGYVAGVLARGRGACAPRRRRDRAAGEGAHGAVHRLKACLRIPFSPRAYWQLVRGNPNFRRLWGAQVVSELGDWFYSLAIYSLLLELTGSAAAVALAVVLQVLPQTLVGPTAGVVNDRASRKRVMIAADLARAAIVLGMLFVRTPALVWLVWPLLLMETVMAAFFEPARNAVIPNITTPETLMTANTLSSTTWSFNLAIGATLGGVVAALLGRDAVFILNGASFLVSALLIRRMRFAEPHMEGRSPLRVRDLADFSPIVEGLRYIAGDKRLLATVFVKFGLGLMGSNNVILPILGERVFPIRLEGLSPQRGAMLGMSLLMGARGAGSLHGAVRRRRVVRP